MLTNGAKIVPTRVLCWNISSQVGDLWSRPVSSATRGTKISFNSSVLIRTTNSVKQEPLYTSKIRLQERLCLLMAEKYY